MDKPAYLKRFPMPIQGMSENVKKYFFS